MRGEPPVNGRAIGKDLIVAPPVPRIEYTDRLDLARAHSGTSEFAIVTLGNGARSSPPPAKATGLAGGNIAVRLLRHLLPSRP